MDNRNPLKEAGESYYKGLHESASLKRARKPYQFRNLATGAAIIAFIGGVYLYSISAVKQDDFSDVVDLIPSPEERKAIRTIEDEMRDKELAAKELGELTGAAGDRASAKIASAGQKAQDAAESVKSSVLAMLPRGLSGQTWVQQRGWVEDGKGNLLVWGAPSVDNIGNVRDNWGVSAGRRVV